MKARVQAEPVPAGYQNKDGIAWGTSRATGLLEIKFNTPQNRNAITSPLLLAKLINDAQADTSIKVILLHGGKFYSSGNNLTTMASLGKMNMEERKAFGHASIFGGINPYVHAINNSNKPIVAVVRGGAAGIGFTALALTDFVYASPDAYFMTPFMKTF